MQRVLFWVAVALWVVGAALVIGNLTGWFPTFPYAGAVAQIIASILTALAQGQRLEPATTTQPQHSIITLVFLFALSSAGWLSVADALSGTGAGVGLRLLVAGFFTAVFVTLASKTLRQRQNGGSSEV